MTPVVEYVCPFVPAELISAWGFEPRRKKLIGSSNSAQALDVRRNLSAGVCAVAEAMLCEFADTSAAGVVFTTACDQMRRMQEIFARHSRVPSFLLNVPASWKDSACLAYYKSELERLGLFLKDIGGKRPEAKTLAHTVRSFAQQRSRTSSASPEGSFVNLAVIGSELRLDDDWIFSYLRSMGGRVVLDATYNGEMLCPACDLPAELDADPLGALAEMYFAMPHPHQRPDSKFFDHVVTGIDRLNVKGVVLVRMAWCDTCHGFARRLKHKINVPLIEIAEADSATARLHVRTRLNAFMEMIG